MSVGRREGLLARRARVLPVKMDRVMFMVAFQKKRSVQRRSWPCYIYQRYPPLVEWNIVVDNRDTRITTCTQ